MSCREENNETSVTHVEIVKRISNVSEHQWKTRQIEALYSQYSDCWFIV